jgi:uncharacterized oligopeptide transporter (OPT) family protein
VRPGKADPLQRVVATFSAISGRMISSQALSSAIPAPEDRGAYMSISSSLHQLAGGVASSCAGLLVSQTGDGPLDHYERLGYVVASSMVVGVALMGRVNMIVQADTNDGRAPVAMGVRASEGASTE